MVVMFGVSAAVSGQALAASTYLLQLGTAPSREEADTIYQHTLEQHKDAIGGYEYLIKDSKRAAADKRFRVQVGPVENRKTANRICAKLRAEDADCFVVETAQKAVLTAAAKSKESPTEQPPEASSESGTSSFWDMFSSGDDSAKETSAKATQVEDAEKPAATVTASKKSAVTQTAEKNININTSSVREMEAPEVPEVDLVGSIASLFGSDEPQEETPKAEAVTATSAAPEPTRVGDVAVATAIPVPLSDDVNTEAPLPKIKVVEGGKTPEAVAAKLAQKQLRAGKVLQIGTFTDGPSAMTCWDKIVTAEPAFRQLKARAITGISGSVGLPRATLHISPVKESLKPRMCELSSICGEDISCRTPSNEPAATAAAHKNASEPLPPGGHWVQLGNFPSYAHAQSRFEELQETQGEVMVPYEAVIRAPVNARAKTYRLRIGPFETFKEADQLCWKLAARGVDCLAVSE